MIIKRLAVLLPVLLALGVLLHRQDAKPPPVHRPVVRGGTVHHVGKTAKKHAKMALNPAGYTSSAAGIAADSNQQWLPATGNDANGNQYVTNGRAGAILRYGYIVNDGNYPYHSEWVISDRLGGYGNWEYQGPTQSSVAYPGFTDFPLTGWLGSVSGSAPAPTFTVNSSSGSGGATHAPATFTDTLLTSGFTASPMTRASQSFSDTLLTGSFAAGPVQSGPVHYEAAFYDTLLTSAFLSGPRNAAPQTFADTLFVDGFLPQPRAFEPQVFTGTLLTDGFSSAFPRSFGPVSFPDTLFTGSGGRTGAGSGAGGTSPAFSFSDTLLTDGFLSGPRRAAPRAFADTLLTDGFQGGPTSRSFSFSDTLLTGGFSGGPKHSAVLPGMADDRDPFAVFAAEMRKLLLFAKGNPMTLLSSLLAVTDKIAAAYRVNEISQAANTLATLPTLIRGGDGTTSAVYGFGQDAPILALLPAAESLLASSAPNLILNAQYRPFMSALRGYASNLGFPSFDAYLSAQNTPLPHLALVHPNFALLNWLFNAQAGTLLMSPGNVFAPSTVFGTVLVGPGAGSAAFTHLSDIPAANVVSPAAEQSTQGYTAAPGCTANVTQAITGTLTLTLTASGQNAAGQAVSRRTWTAALDNAPAGASIPFVPAIAGDRIYGASSCTGSGAATAGAVTVISVLERIVS